MKGGWIGPLRIAGVDVRVHVLLLLLPASLFATRGGDDDAGVRLGLFAVVLVSVLLHELGHAFVAKARGLRVHDVRLHLLGGAARIERRLPLAWDPRDEWVVSLAGPAVNLAIAAVLAGIALVGRRAVPELEVRAWVGDLFAGTLATNLLMGGLNLLPVFPADGGRVLRALLAYRASYLAATRVALVTTALGTVALVVWGVTRTTRTGLAIGLATAVVLALGAQREWAWARVRRKIEVFRDFVRERGSAWPALAALPLDAEGQPFPSPTVFEDPALCADLEAFAAAAGDGSPFRSR